MKKIIAMLLTLAMVLAFAGCASTETPATEAPETEAAVVETTEAPVETEAAETEAEVAVMTHEEYMAAELESAVCIETYVQAHQSWWDNKVTVYCQSEDGAYFLYELACSEEDAAKLVPGVKIRVTGYKGEWAGEVEIMDGTFEFVDDGTMMVVAPFDATALLGTDELIAHQNEKVSFTGLEVVASTDANGNEAAFLYNWDGSGEQGNDLYFNVKVNDQVYNFCVESYLCGADTEVYQAVEALQIGDIINAEGFLYWYDGVNPHITAISAAE